MLVGYVTKQWHVPCKGRINLFYLQTRRNTVKYWIKECYGSINAGACRLFYQVVKMVENLF